MDWDSIFGIILAALLAIGLPLAFRKRKKSGLKKREEFCQHLQEMGLKASLAETGDHREKIGLSHFSGQKSEGVIELQDRNIDAINVISLASQYGPRYFLDYLVRSPSMMGERILKKTRLIRKKSPPLWGRIMAIEWRGDESLAQSLNLDYSLEDNLLRPSPQDFKGGIWIFPERKHGYARIRTDYSPPSAGVFEAISIIARHIRSW